MPTLFEAAIAVLLTVIVGAYGTAAYQAYKHPEVFQQQPARPCGCNYDVNHSDESAGGILGLGFPVEYALGVYDVK